MAAVALALLLAASLDAASASLDAAGARALFGRLARGPKGAVRRLSGDDDDNATFMEGVSEECKAECPGLDDFIATMNALEASEEPEESEEKWSGVLPWVDSMCDHKTALQCFKDTEECADPEHGEMIEILAPMLTCICDTCSGANVALAKFLRFKDDDDEDHDDEGQDGQEGQRRMSGAETTTEGMMPETTIEGLSGDQNDEKAMKCAVYEMALCKEEYPTECSAIVDLGHNITEATVGDMGDQLEEMCTGDFAPGAGGDDHNDTDGDGDGDGDGDDDDDAGDVVGGCGPVGLGWLVASVPTVMAALQLVAA